AVAGAFVAGVLSAAKMAGLASPSVEFLHGLLPLTEHGVGWVLPALALGIVGSMVKEKDRRRFRVLVICPSQLCTKVALYENMSPIFSASVPHVIDQAMSEAKRVEQFEFLEDEILDRLSKNRIDLSTVDAVTARCGFLHPVEGGAYRITERMLCDLEKNPSRHHPSNWGPAIAYRIASHSGLKAFVVDPVVVDEMTDIAHMTGLPEVRRASIFHASNQKATCRRVAQNLWKRHDRINAIIAHIGEGTSVAAHAHGRVIDVNNAFDGDGPFSALTSGSLPVYSVVKMCFEDGAEKDEILSRVRSSGGLKAYLGTADAGSVDRMLRGGDEKASRAVEAMAYQVAKEIGALAAALSGKVDAVALTGELAGCRSLVRQVRSRVRFLAPFFVMPGESETEALVGGALRVLKGQDGLKEYMPPAMP
nr:butyrate kinase [bacterium]